MSELTQELDHNFKEASIAFMEKLDADLDKAFPRSQRARRRREELAAARATLPRTPGVRADLEMRKCFENEFECKWDEGSKMNQLVFALGYARGKGTTSPMPSE